MLAIQVQMKLSFFSPQVGIPDISMMQDAPEEGMMSMSAGDFVDVYSRPHYAQSFDCVATCFFLDCAHNVIEFVEIIHRILKVLTI